MKSSIEKRLKKLEDSLDLKPKCAVVLCDAEILHSHDFSFIEADNLILLPYKDDDELYKKDSYTIRYF